MAAEKLNKKAANAHIEELNRLRDFKKEFLADFRADEKWLTDIKKYGRYYDGDQWTEDERRVLESRGQPVTTINRIKPKLDSIFGIQSALRVDTKAFPFGNKEQEIEIVSEQIRLIENQSDFDDQESEVFKDQTIDGRGWYHAKKEFVEDRKFTVIEKVDRRDVIPDRYSKRQDLKDAKRIHHTVWMDMEDAKSLWPHKKDEIEKAALSTQFGDTLASKEAKNLLGKDYQMQMGGFEDHDFESFVDKKKRRLRVTTTYYRTLVAQKLFFHPNLPNGFEDITGFDKKSTDALIEANPDGEIVDQHKKQLNFATYLWNVMLQDDEYSKNIRSYDPEAKFPFIKVEGYRDRWTGRNYGIIKQMIDAQDEVNKRRSKAVHLMNVRRTLFEKGAWDNESTAKTEVSRPDAWLGFKKGFQVTIDENIELGQQHFALLQQATREIDNAGVTQEIEGQSRATSGRDFQLRQQQAMQSIRELFKNLRNARRRVGLYLVDEILHDNPELGKAVSRIDVVIEEAPESINLQGETFEKLVSLANSGIPVPPEILVESSTLSKSAKEKWMQSIQAQQQAMQLAAQQGGVPQ